MPDCKKERLRFVQTTIDSCLLRIEGLESDQKRLNEANRIAHDRLARYRTELREIEDELAATMPNSLFAWRDDGNGCDGKWLALPEDPKNLEGEPYAALHFLDSAFTALKRLSRAVEDGAGRDEMGLALKEAGRALAKCEPVAGRL